MGYGEFLKQDVAQGYSPFESAYAGSIIAADLVLGGNIRSQKGGDHVIADSWTSGCVLPALYDSPSVAFFLGKGVNPQTTDAVKHFLVTTDAMDLPKEAKVLLKILDPSRRAVIERTLGSIDVMLSVALALAENNPLPAL